VPIRVVTGLDWSGDVGDPNRENSRNDLLVFAACHAHREQLEDVRECWSRLRESLGFRQSHVFKHVHTRPDIRPKIYAALSSMPVRFSVNVVDKSAWPRSYLYNTSGMQRIIDPIVDLFDACSPDIVADQVLVIDGHPSEKGFVDALKRAMRRSFAVQDKRSFSKISVIPDDRIDSILIQAADLMAGEIRSGDGEVPGACESSVDFVVGR